MGTKFKTPQEKFDYRMEKKGMSIEKEVCLILKPRTSWEAGLSFNKLKAEVERRFNRTFCNGRIYEAVSLINRFGKHQAVYLRSSFGYVVDENNIRKIEHRYYIPTEPEDVYREEKDLENRKEIIHLKKDHLEHHTKVTIPQEQKLALIQR